MSDPLVIENNTETMTGITTARKRARRLCVVTAADVEFKTVVSLLDSAALEPVGSLKLCHGVLRDSRITVLMSEIGANGFASQLARHLAEEQYDALLVIGLGGALDARLRLGDVVVYQSCLQMMNPAVTVSSIASSKKINGETTEKLTCDSALAMQLSDWIKASGLTCHLASGITTNRIIVDASEKLRLRERTGAAMVDMESFGVLEICEQFQLPAAVIRVVSDEAGQDLPDFNQALTPTGKISSMRAVLAMIRRPVAAARFLVHLTEVTTALKVAAKVVLQ